MTEQTENRQVLMHRVYVLDTSFESPHAPAIFSGDWKPQVDVQINTGSEVSDQGENLWNVSLKVTVEAKLEEKTAYIVEVEQGGLFTVAGFADAERQQVLATFCPQQLFPFVREAVANLIERGSFPQFLLQPVNFDALFAQHQEQVKKAQDESAASVKH